MRAAILARLRRLGVAVGDEELLTPAVLAVRLCRQLGHRRVALLVRDDVRARLVDDERP